MRLSVGIGAHIAPRVAKTGGAVLPSLPSLALSSYSLTQGEAVTINILGATATSVLTVASGALPTGLTLNSGARTITGTPSGTGTSNFAIDEALGGYANSPRRNNFAITVEAVVVAPSDSTPNAYSFTDATGAELSTVTESNQLTLAGTDINAAISITGGEYQIGAGSWTSTSGTIAPGSLFRVRLTSSASYSAIASATLTIGGVSDTFSVTTKADPTPAPVVDNRLVAEGDSITSAGPAGYNYLYDTNFAAVDYYKGDGSSSMGGSTIGASSATVPSLLNRQAAVLALNPEVLTVFIGANDLDNVGRYPTTQDWLDALFAYIAPFRAAGTKVAVGTILNKTGSATHTSRRSEANNGIRLAIGSQIDAVFDFAADPTIGTDAAASDTGLFSDGLHPTQSAHATYLYPIYAPVVSALLDGKLVAAPVLTLTSADATPPTYSFSYAIGTLDSDMVRQQIATNIGFTTGLIEDTQAVGSDGEMIWPNLTEANFPAGETRYVREWIERGGVQVSPASNVLTVAVAAVGGTFDPLTTFDDLWDAGDESTITGTGATFQVANQIGTIPIIAHDSGGAATTGDASKDVNGLNTIYFDGSTDRMRMQTAKAYGNTFHIFFAMYFDPTVYGATTSTLLSIGDPDGDPAVYLGNNGAAAPGVVRLQHANAGVTPGNASTFAGTGTAVPTTAMHLVELVFDGTTPKVEVWFDGVLKYTSAAYTGFSGISQAIGVFYRLGLTARATGRFGSLAVKQGSILTGTTLTDARAYFATRWGITL